MKVTKICTKCGEDKPVSSFHKNRDGFRPDCKTCNNARSNGWHARNKDRSIKYYDENRHVLNAQSREWYVKNKDRAKASARKSQFKKYNISPEQYLRQYEIQKGMCAVCGGLGLICGHGNKGEVLHVDHCHRTGAVRGLLCTRCNPGIGFLKDDPIILRKAAAYLEKPPWGW